MQAKPNLDFMRAIAVLLVVVDHTCLGLRVRHIGSWDAAFLGNLGVFMFFVHTSVVLMWSLERKPHTLDFYIRRVFRIYPLGLLAITVALLTKAPLAGTVDNIFGRHLLSTKDILAHCLLVQNLRPSTPPLVNVMWTLPLEVDMYILLPALFFFVRKNLSIWPLLLFWALAVAFCRSTFSPYEVDVATVVPMFLPGVIAYVGFSRRRTAILPAWSFALFLAVLIAIGMHNPLTNRKGWYFNLALGLALPLFAQWRSRWIVSASHNVAKYSYGIYLTHPFGLVLGMYVLAGHSIATQLTVEVVFIAITSVAVYHLLEKPMINMGTRVAALAERNYEQMSAPERTATVGA